MENLAYLPTKIVRFTDKKAPVFAQWNYRIACHPISRDIPTKYFEPRFDAAAQLRNRADDDQYINSRAARFDIEGVNIDGERVNDMLDYTFLDSIMEEIPGKNLLFYLVVRFTFTTILVYFYERAQNDFDVKRICQ